MKIMRLLFPQLFAARDKTHADAIAGLELAKAETRQTRQAIQSGAHVLGTMSGAIRIIRDSNRGKANG